MRCSLIDISYCNKYCHRNIIEHQHLALIEVRQWFNLFEELIHYHSLSIISFLGEFLNYHYYYSSTIRPL